MPKKEAAKDEAAERRDRPAKLRNMTEDHTEGMSLTDDESEDTRRRIARIALIVAARSPQQPDTPPILVTDAEIHEVHQAGLRVVMERDVDRHGWLVSFEAGATS